jgi:hypothetical protein
MMKTIKLLWLLPLCMMLAVVSGCDNDTDTDTDTDDLWVEGTIVRCNDLIVVEAVWWSVRINGILTYPRSLEERYKVDGLKVEIVYERSPQIGFCSTSPGIIIKKIRLSSNE